ncbi:MAG: hypothetical protein EA397_16915 [Deltaproteobacteria bacterium]|nr:MAG: hypothetical protein EA397_16915 [Deltaproteobacteria bacterium]
MLNLAFVAAFLLGCSRAEAPLAELPADGSQRPSTEGELQPDARSTGPTASPEAEPAPGAPAHTEPSMSASPTPSEIAQAWAAERYGAQATVGRIGTATGSTAYVVRVGEPGSRPTTEQPIVVHDGDVLVGKSGWTTFLKAVGRDDPSRLAAGWLVLYKGDAQEPFGSKHLYRRESLPDPAWEGDHLVALISGHRGALTRVELSIDERGHVTVVSEHPWSEAPSRPKPR